MLIADFYTKPLQGSLFIRFRKIILNLDDDVLGSNLVTKDRKINRKPKSKTKPETSQKCVENNSKKVHRPIKNVSKSLKSKNTSTRYSRTYIHKICMK